MEYELDYDVLEYAKEDYENHFFSLLDSESSKLSTEQDRNNFALTIKSMAEFMVKDSQSRLNFNNFVPVFKARFVVNKNSNKKTWNKSNSVPVDFVEEFWKQGGLSNPPFESDNPNGHYAFATDALAVLNDRQYSVRRILPEDPIEFLGVKDPNNPVIKFFNSKNNMANAGTSLGEQMLEMAMVKKIDDFSEYQYLMDFHGLNSSPVDRAVYEMLRDEGVKPRPFQVPALVSRQKIVSLPPNLECYQKTKNSFPDIYEDLSGRFKQFKGKKELVTDVQMDNSMHMYRYTKVSPEEDRAGAGKDKYDDLISYMSNVTSVDMDANFRELTNAYLSFKYTDAEEEIRRLYKRVMDDIIKHYEATVDKVSQKKASVIEDLKRKLKEKLEKLLRIKNMEMKAELSKHRLSLMMSLVTLFTSVVIINRPKQVIKNIDTRYFPVIASGTDLETEMSQYMKYFVQLLVLNDINALDNVYISSVKRLPGNHQTVSSLLLLCKSTLDDILQESPLVKQLINRNVHRLRVLDSKTLKEIWKGFRPVYKQHLDPKESGGSESSYILQLYKWAENLGLKSFSVSNTDAYYPTYFRAEFPVGPKGMKRSLNISDVRLLKYTKDDREKQRFIPQRRRLVSSPPSNIKKSWNSYPPQLSTKDVIEEFMSTNNMDSAKLETDAVPQSIEPYLKDNPNLVVATLIKAMVHLSVQGQRAQTPPPSVSVSRKYNSAEREVIQNIWSARAPNSGAPTLYNVKDLQFDQKKLIENQKVLFRVFEHVFKKQRIPAEIIQNIFVKKDKLINEFETSKDRAKQRFSKNVQEEKRRKDEIMSQMSQNEEVTSDDYNVEYSNWNSPQEDELDFGDRDEDE